MTLLEDLHFKNQYNAEDALQKKFNATCIGCLCTMREVCNICRTEEVAKRNAERLEIVKEAYNLGYQLYFRPSVISGGKATPLDYDYYFSNNKD